MAKNKNEEEWLLIKTQLLPITRKEKKTSQEIQKELAVCLKIIKKIGKFPEGKKLLVESLQRIVPKEHELTSGLNSLQKISKSLEMTDFRGFQELRVRYQQLPSKEKEEIRQRILLKKTQVLDDRKLQELVIRVTGHAVGVRDALSATSLELVSENISSAHGWVKRALTLEKEAEGLLKGIHRLEKRLSILAQMEFQSFSSVDSR